MLHDSHLRIIVIVSWYLHVFFSFTLQSFRSAVPGFMKSEAKQKQTHVFFFFTLRHFIRSKLHDDIFKKRLFVSFICVPFSCSPKGEQLRGCAAFPDGLWHQRAKDHTAVFGCHPETHVPWGRIWGEGYKLAFYLKIGYLYFHMYDLQMCTQEGNLVCRRPNKTTVW